MKFAQVFSLNIFLTWFKCDKHLQLVIFSNNKMLFTFYKYKKFDTIVVSFNFLSELYFVYLYIAAQNWLILELPCWQLPDTFTLLLYLQCMLWCQLVEAQTLSVTKVTNVMIWFWSHFVVLLKSDLDVQLNPSMDL